MKTTKPKSKKEAKLAPIVVKIPGKEAGFVLSDALVQLPVTRIKEECRKRGIPIAKYKGDMTTRLLDAMSKEPITVTIG